MPALSQWPRFQPGWMGIRVIMCLCVCVLVCLSVCVFAGGRGVGVKDEMG